MIQTITTTDKEKYEMYNALSKDSLIKMLIEANKHLDRLTPKVGYENVKKYNESSQICFEHHKINCKTCF